VVELDIRDDLERLR